MPPFTDFSESGKKKMVSIKKLAKELTVEECYELGVKSGMFSLEQVQFEKEYFTQMMGVDITSKRPSGNSSLGEYVLARLDILQLYLRDKKHGTAVPIRSLDLLYRNVKKIAEKKCS